MLDQFSREVDGLDLDIQLAQLCRQFVYLHTQVARRGSRLLLDVGELCFVGTDEKRHDGQSQLRVQEWIYWLERHGLLLFFEHPAWERQADERE